MNLPLVLQMEIDLSVMAHKREIAEGFAKLRAKFAPESPPVDPAIARQAAYLQQNPYYSNSIWAMLGLAPMENTQSAFGTGQAPCASNQALGLSALSQYNWP